MPYDRSPWTARVVVLALLVGTPPAHGSETPPACAAARLRVEADGAADALACHRRAALGGGPVGRTCLERARERLVHRLARVAAARRCGGEGRGGAIVTQLQQFTIEIAATLRPTAASNACAAAKLHAAAD